MVTEPGAITFSSVTGVRDEGDRQAKRVPGQGKTRSSSSQAAVSHGTVRRIADVHAQSGTAFSSPAASTDFGAQRRDVARQNWNIITKLNSTAGIITRGRRCRTD